jgi:hypothetical protein
MMHGLSLAVTLYHGCTVPSLRMRIFLLFRRLLFKSHVRHCTLRNTSSKFCSSGVKKFQKKAISTKHTGTDRHVTGKQSTGVIVRGKLIADANDTAVKNVQFLRIFSLWSSATVC